VAAERPLFAPEQTDSLGLEMEEEVEEWAFDFAFRMSSLLLANHLVNS